MNPRTLAIASIAYAAIAFASGGFAAPVMYEGALFSGASMTSTVPTGNGWINNEGGEVDYWYFPVQAGDMVTIRVHAVDPRLDPAFSFYTGFTTADTSQFSNFSDWGGLTFIDFGATLTPGGGEDAVWSFAAQTHALYTIAVGGWDSAGCPSGCSSAFGPYPYLVTVTGNTGNNTPEPMTLALFGIGIAGVAFARRKSFNDLRRAS